MNSIPGGSEGPLAGMTQSRFDQFYASMAENQEILVRITNLENYIVCIA
jgi:hypothetical protein